MEDLNINLKELVQTYSGIIFKIGLILVILATFFLFSNLTSEFFETPKFLVLLVFSGLLLVLLTLRFTIDNKVILIRTPLDIPLLLLLAVGIISTVLSPSPFIALLGDQLKIHGSLVSLITYVIFYFVLIHNFKNAKEVKWLLNLVIIASQLLAVISLLSYSGLRILPAPWAQTVNFTPTGSTFSTTAILALFLPFIVTQVLNSRKPLFLILNSIFLLLSGLTIALTGTWATWIAALTAFVLTLFISNLRNLSNLRDLSNLNSFSLIRLVGLISPIVIIALTIILSVIPPLGCAKNPLYAKAQAFPREIQLNFKDSWKISISAFRDSPFWGTGPASYTFNFTNYKPVEFNASKSWNLRFDSPFNEYLLVLANLGGIGLVALLSLTALFISSAYRVIWQEMRLRNRTNSLPQTAVHQPADQLQTLLAISGLVFFIILALHAGTLGLWVTGLLMLAAFMVVSQKNNQNSFGLNQNKPGLNNLKGAFLRIAGFSNSNSPAETIRIDALPGTLLTIALALVLSAVFFGSKLVLADYHHRLALNAISQNQGIIAYNELTAAEKLNPQNDLYRTDLAQINFALANALAAAKGPTEASPTGSLTDQDKQTIQTLLQQSINEGKAATALSPRSSTNWEILGLLYRQIAGVAQNALLFSLDSYGRAIFQDPLNPNLRVSVGGVYYAIKNYDLAIRFFTDAINLKPDFANGYYNLSVALRDKGDLSNAQALAEKLLTLVDKNSNDYKVANDYLTDLKAKIEASSPKTTEAPTQPPAAGTSGALQKEELPKVINLPKPEQIATPEAVKKPETTPTPTPSPAPAEQPTANP